MIHDITFTCTNDRFDPEPNEYTGDEFIEMCAASFDADVEAVWQSGDRVLAVVDGEEVVIGHPVEPPIGWCPKRGWLDGGDF